MLVVVLFWDTHRIAALCGVTIVYLADRRSSRSGGSSARRKADAPPFAATLAELERDRAWLAEHGSGDGK